MLLRQATLDGIRTGAITLAFRRWRRPTVKTGGTLLTAIGLLSIRQVQPIEPAELTPAQARKAGYDSLDALLTELGDRPGQLYRIELGSISADPRLALRERPPTADETKTILSKLARMDTLAKLPWTRATLAIIADQPGIRAGDLADRLGMERLPFKSNVRKLKALGLTISLEIGYELAPRGLVVLRELQHDPLKRAT